MSTLMLRQRWWQAFLPGAAAGLFWRMTIGVDDEKGFPPSPPLVLLVVLLVGFITGLMRRTIFAPRLDQQGVTIGPPRIARSLPWREVQTIEERRRFGARRVVLRRFQGPPGWASERMLLAPIDARLLPDPDFDAKVAKIRAWWLDHREL